MKFKITTILKKHFFIQSIFILFTIFSFGQNIQAPTFNGTSDICAEDSSSNPNANKFVFKFQFSGLGTNTTFILEMSNANGSFASPTIQDQQVITTSPGFLTLTVPSNFVGGDGYKFRVRNLANTIISGIEPDPFIPTSERAFKIYFKLALAQLTINEGQSNATICGNFGLTLSVDDPATLATTSIRYIWTRNTVAITGETGPTLLVTTSGVYQCSFNYGPCGGSGTGLQSQLVTVSFGTSGTNYIITSSNGNTVAAGSPTTLSTPPVAGNTYKWYKDGSVYSPLNTTNSLITDEIGIYFLEVKDATCTSRTNKIKLGGPGSNPQGGTVIPNIITPNNDASNDTWILPEEYIIGTNTNITIFDGQGKTALSTDNYNNDWPQTPIDFAEVNPVFYYIITPADGIIKKGSITILK